MFEVVAFACVPVATWLLLAGSADGWIQQQQQYLAQCGLCAIVIWNEKEDGSPRRVSQDIEAWGVPASRPGARKPASKPTASKPTMPSTVRDSLESMVGKAEEWRTKLKLIRSPEEHGKVFKEIGEFAETYQTLVWRISHAAIQRGKEIDVSELFATLGLMRTISGKANLPPELLPLTVQRVVELAKGTKHLDHELSMQQVSNLPERKQVSRVRRAVRMRIPAGS